MIAGFSFAMVGVLGAFAIGQEVSGGFNAIRNGGIATFISGILLGIVTFIFNDYYTWKRGKLELMLGRSS